MGLFYGQRFCRFGLYREVDGDAKFRDEFDQPLDLTPVFEARLFTDRGELRWWNDPERHRTGKAAYLSDVERGPSGWDGPHPELVTGSPNQYLLWGEQWTSPTAGKPQADRKLVRGWSLLAAGRIGSLAVPFPGTGSGSETLGKAERVVLLTTEYFGAAPGDAGKHGNIVVVEERLKTLAKLVPAKEVTP